MKDLGQMLLTDGGYMKLIRRAPLVTMRTRGQLAQAHEIIDELLERELTPGEEAYLDALSVLVEACEEEMYPVPVATEADILRGLMDGNGYSQAELADEAGIARTTITAVLNGKRALTKAHIRALADRFSLSPSVFLPESAGPESEPQSQDDWPVHPVKGAHLPIMATEALGSKGVRITRASPARKAQPAHQRGPTKRLTAKKAKAPGAPKPVE